LVRALARQAPALPLVMLVALSGCGDESLLPSTVDPGPDFSVADVVFDDSYFYCQVEPVLFASRCGPGDPAQGDASGGCHYNVTSYRLTDYSPLVADTCSGNVPAPGSISEAARQNYQTSQARMKRDPEIAPLLQKPLKKQQHPRQIFDASSAEADVIRQWATRFSAQ
jgi:hypothetical protein